MILATASALHGHDTLSKGILMAISAGIYAGLYCYFLGWLGLIALVLVPIWWFGLRRSRQENIENDFMHQGGNGPATLRDVFKAHYYTGLLTCISLMVFNYSTERGQKLGWEHQWAKQGHVRGKPVRVDEEGRVHPDDMPFWDCRRPTEAATGLTADIILILILTGFCYYGK